MKIRVGDDGITGEVIHVDVFNRHHPFFAPEFIRRLGHAVSDGHPDGSWLVVNGVSPEVGWVLGIKDHVILGTVSRWWLSLARPGQNDVALLIIRPHLESVVEQYGLVLVNAGRDHRLLKLTVIGVGSQHVAAWRLVIGLEDRRTDHCVDPALGVCPQRVSIGVEIAAGKLDERPWDADLLPVNNLDNLDVDVVRWGCNSGQRR
jgi:hypothetical protein